MTEGRLELHVPISGYVIAPDRSLGARARSAWRRVRFQALRIGVHARYAGRAMHRAWRDVRESALWEAFSAVAGRFGAVLALLSHLTGREDAIEKASPPRQRQTGIAIVSLIVLAFAAALFMPERGEAVYPADAPLPEEVQSAPRSVSQNAPEIPLAQAAISPPPLQWQAVRKPMAMYHLESPDMAGLELNYRVSMRGTSRQDSLIFLPKADASGETRRSLAQIVIERHEDRSITEKPLFADLAARAAEQRLIVERMARPQDIRTKFGAFEAAETTIRQEDKVLSCIGFRRIDMAGLTLVGWVCGAAQRPVDRVALVCLIDRLDLVAGGRDARLRKVFSEAERARAPCSSSRQSGKRLTWLDHEAPVPGLKLSARGR